MNLGIPLTVRHQISLIKRRGVLAISAGIAAPRAETWTVKRNVKNRFRSRDHRGRRFKVLISETSFRPISHHQQLTQAHKREFYSTKLIFPDFFVMCFIKVEIFPPNDAFVELNMSREWQSSRSIKINDEQPRPYNLFIYFRFILTFFFIVFVVFAHQHTHAVQWEHEKRRKSQRDIVGVSTFNQTFQRDTIA